VEVTAMTKQRMERVVRYMLDELMKKVEKSDALTPGASIVLSEGPMDFSDETAGEALWGLVRVFLAPDEQTVIKLAQSS
jgi:hypothetical protein